MNKSYIPKNVSIFGSFEFLDAEWDKFDCIDDYRVNICHLRGRRHSFLIPGYITTYFSCDWTYSFGSHTIQCTLLVLGPERINNMSWKMVFAVLQMSVLMWKRRNRRPCKTGFERVSTAQRGRRQGLSKMLLFAKGWQALLWMENLWDYIF